MTYTPHPAAQAAAASTRCGHMSHHGHGRCVLSPGHDDSIEHLYPVPATPIEDIAQNVRDAITYSSDTTSPVLATIRDLILTLPGSTPASALASARVILAAHTRELADSISAAITADRGATPPSTDRKASLRRTGMMRTRTLLNRYADDLDAAAVDGE